MSNETKAADALPSDAPAVTIARLSVELAAARGQVARMRLILARLAELAALWKEQKPSNMIGYGGAALAVSSLLTGTVLPAPDDIAVTRERYERMVKALGMGPELARVSQSVESTTNGTNMLVLAKRRDFILDEMKAAAKA